MAIAKNVNVQDQYEQLNMARGIPIRTTVRRAISEVQSNEEIDQFPSPLNIKKMLTVYSIIDTT